MVFLPGAHMPQTLKLDGKQGGFDLRRNQACFVKIFQVGLIFGPEARELHAHQVIERRQPEATKCTGHTEFRGRLRIKLLHLFPGEDHMHRATGRRLACSNQHVDTRDMAVRKAKWLDSLSDCGKILTANRDIDIAGEASGIRVTILHVEIRGEPSDNPVVQSGGREGVFNDSSQFK